jgi:hypothetical protein
MGCKVACDVPHALVMRVPACNSESRHVRFTPNSGLLQRGHVRFGPIADVRGGGAYRESDNVIPPPDLDSLPGVKNQSRLKEKSGFSSSFAVGQAAISHRWSRFSRKGKTRWLLLLMWLLASPPPMLTNQRRPRRGRASSSASWMHSGKRDATKLAARLQKTLTYYHTILDQNRLAKESICAGSLHANNTRHCGGLRWHLSRRGGITEQYGHAHRDGRDEQPNLSRNDGSSCLATT